MHRDASACAPFRQPFTFVDDALVTPQVRSVLHVVCQSARAMADALSPGVVVAGTFEVERLLGRGGMGEVWLGRRGTRVGRVIRISFERLERSSDSGCSTPGC